MGSEMCIRDSLFTGLDLYYTDLAQHLTKPGWNLDDLDRDLSDLSDA